MPRATVVKFLGEIERQTDALALVKRAGDYAIVTRGVRRSIVMACPDACGEVLTLNLDRRSGKAWRIYGPSKRLSLSPSVWKETGCRAHFIVWRGHILWCLDDHYERPDIEHSLIKDVQTRLAVDYFLDYEQIATDADLNPWDVLWACEALVKEGKAVAGHNLTFKSALDPKNRGGRSI